MSNSFSCTIAVQRAAAKAQRASVLKQPSTLCISMGFMVRWLWACVWLWAWLWLVMAVALGMCVTVGVVVAVSLAVGVGVAVAVAVSVSLPVDVVPTVAVCLGVAVEEAVGVGVNVAGCGCGGGCPLRRQRTPGRRQASEAGEGASGYNGCLFGTFCPCSERMPGAGRITCGSLAGSPSWRITPQGRNSHGCITTYTGCWHMANTFKSWNGAAMGHSILEM